MGCVACISCWKKNNSNILYVFTAPLPPTPSPSSPKESSAVLAGIPAAGGGGGLTPFTYLDFFFFV